MTDVILEPLILSFKLSLVSTVLLLIVSFPIAYIIAYKGFKGKFFLEAFLALPLVLPPTVLGLFILVIFGKNTFLGDVYFQIFNSPLVFSFEGLVVASMLYSLPFCVQPLLTSFRSIDIAIIENAMTFGMKKIDVFLKVLLPSAR